jgi:hypothetical protein
MAVTLAIPNVEYRADHYIGLSTDAKPSLGPNKVGSSFRESNTNKLFLWDGAAWFQTGSTTADGGNIVLGATTDAAVSTDTTGTISGKLRGLVKIFADVWNSTSHFLSVSLATLIAGEDQTYGRMRTMPAYNSTQIATQTTTVVKNASGILGRIVISTPIANAVVDVYDHASGAGTKLIPTITLPATFKNDAPIVIEVDAIATIGITVITGGATMGVGVYWL